MNRKAATVAEYLASLPEDRRQAIAAVRQVFRENLDTDYQETMQYGMIGYSVPHRIYPAGYHCDPKQPLPFAGLCSQKAHMSMYLMGVYGNPAQEEKLREAWAKAGKKIDMGKSCIRFKKLDDLPLEALGDIIRGMPVKTYIAQYEAARAAAERARPEGTAGAKKQVKAAAKGPKPAAASKEAAVVKKTVGTKKKAATR
jgi:hypothetical protein